MTLGKIVSLRHIPYGGYKVESGIDLKNGLWSSTFARLVSPRNAKHCTYINSYKVEGDAVLLKTDWLDLKEIPEEVNEEFLMVIIHFSSEPITSTGQKIAGEHKYSGIWVLKPGDTLTVYKKDKGRKYMAVQAGNEVLLVKKHR